MAKRKKRGNKRTAATATKTTATKKKTKTKDTNKSLTSFTCKKKNRVIEGLTPQQKNFWKERIFNDENIADVANADARNKTRKLKGVRTNTLSDREKLIGNIIANEIGNDVIVLDSNKNNEVLVPNEIFEYVKRGFTQKVSILNKGNNVARASKPETKSKDIVLAT